MAERTGGRDRWRGFVVLDGRLWYRPPGGPVSPVSPGTSAGPVSPGGPGRSRRPGLRFEPDGLVVVEPGGPGAERPLPWDEGERPAGLARPAWSLHAIPRGRGSRVAFRLTLGRRHVRLRAGPLPPSAELPALCRYLASTPAARPGLADPGHLRALLGRLAASGWRRPGPPHEPLAGERLDLHRLVEATLDEVGWRRIDQRPVAGEPRPAVDDVVAAVRAALPAGLASRTPGSRLRDEVERHLSVGAWPFDCLLPPRNV